MSQKPTFDNTSLPIGQLLVSYPELKLIGIKYSRVHLLRKIRDGTFPPPVELGTGRVAWHRETIVNHVRNLVPKKYRKKRVGEGIMKAQQDRWTILHNNQPTTGLIPNAKGLIPESWLCVDCGVDTAPGCRNRKEVEVDFLLHGCSPINWSEQGEVYCVKDTVWALTKLEGWGGCLCIGCLETRIGRRLKSDDFQPDHPFNSLPGTRRLLKRRGA